VRLLQKVRVSLFCDSVDSLLFGIAFLFKDRSLEEHYFWEQYCKQRL